MDRFSYKIRDGKIKPEIAIAMERVSFEITHSQISFMDRLIQKMLLEAYLWLLNILNFQVNLDSYFTVLVVHTGQFHKIKFRKIFKSGSPSELSYIS